MFACWHTSFQVETHSKNERGVKNQLENTEEKEEILLSPVTKTPTPTEQSRKQRDNIKTPPKLWLHNHCGPT